MIYVVTVHWKDDCWIDPQLEAFRRHSTEEFRVYAFLNHLPPERLQEQIEKFHCAYTEDIDSHAVKLNLLANVICRSDAEDEDLLVFVDGDAFPVADYVSLARTHIPSRKLIAVKREENNGDSHPHPCFCITTVGFWREIRGDWEEGGKWKNRQGEEITDVGGNLLHILESRSINWMPLLRSNGTGLNTLFFAIYGDIAYHHGGGFRRGMGGRIGQIEAGIHTEARRPLNRLLNLLPKRGGLAGKFRERFHSLHILRARIRRETAQISSDVFQRIKDDPESVWKIQ